MTTNPDGDRDERNEPEGDAETASWVPGSDPPKSDPAKDPTIDVSGPKPSSRPTAHRDADGRFAPGTVVADRYRIVARLGAGGMGEVYRADDLQLGESVALKFLSAAVSGDPEWAERIRQEARVARRVTHRNVCRVHDIGEVDGEIFISMEFVDGEDLASLLRRIGRLPGDKALDIAHQICAGLAAAHDEGVLHRDLKPANIMLDGRGDVRLTDFGIAAITERATGDDVRSGTPQYMAPEQFRGLEVTRRSDIYSLGLVLFEIFTGRPAIDGTTLAEIENVHRGDSTTTPSSVHEGIDPVVEGVIVGCLEKDPKKRPESARVVSAGLPGGDPLAAALAAGETPSPEVIAAAGSRGGMKRHWAIFSVFLFVAVSLASILLGESSRIVNRVDPPKESAVLVDQSLRYLQELGYDAVVTERTRAWDWELDRPLVTEWKQRKGDHWEHLAERRPPVLTFWYRDADLPWLPVSSERRFTPYDPPVIRPGMRFLRLDAQGRLVGLRVVPGTGIVEEEQEEPRRRRRYTSGSSGDSNDTDPPSDPPVEDEAEDRDVEEPSPPVGPTDWRLPFAMAGLDYERFEPIAEPHEVGIPVDEQRAWKGAADDASSDIVVHAGSHEGRVNYFEVRVTKPEVAGAFFRPPRPHHWVQGLVDFVINFGLFGITAFLALRNMKLDRVDAKGAIIVATGVFVLSATQHCLEATWGGGIGGLTELRNPLSKAAIAWIFYCAMEPYARRTWPNLLVAWTRLLGGRWRDPLVGRSVLKGLAIGAVLSLGPAAVALFVHDGYTVPSDVGSTWSRFFHGSLGGTSRVISETADTMYASVIIVLFTLLLAVLLQLFLRLRWLAVAACIFVCSLQAANETAALGAACTVQAAIVAAAVGVLGAALFVTTLFRGGLLMAVVAFLSHALIRHVPTLSDLSAWYARSDIIPLGLLVLLGIYGYRVAVRSDE